MKLYKDMNTSYGLNFAEIERAFTKLSKHVMESKQFERKMFYAVAALYIFIFAHIIGFVIGKVF